MSESSVNITMKELLEAGAHYGHQCRRWNPRMKPYIFGERNGVHIIDLQKTAQCLKSALGFLENVASKRGTILFVGTKRQAQELTAEHAKRCNMYFINNRWLGGTLTNYNTIRQSINRLRRFEKMAADGTYENLTKKEVITLERQREKLEKYIGGIKDMPSQPDAIFIADSHKEHIAVKEAKKLGIPIVAIADTNADPQGIDYLIPCNDDSHRSLEIVIKAAADAIAAGRGRSKSGDEANSKRVQDNAVEGTIYDKDGHSVKVMKKKAGDL
jgi:small subunit ribosomal protein S2